MVVLVHLSLLRFISSRSVLAYCQDVDSRDRNYLLILFKHHKYRIMNIALQVSILHLSFLDMHRFGKYFS